MFAFWMTTIKKTEKKCSKNVQTIYYFNKPCVTVTRTRLCWLYLTRQWRSRLRTVKSLTLSPSVWGQCCGQFWGVSCSAGLCSVWSHRSGRWCWLCVWACAGPDSLHFGTPSRISHKKICPCLPPMGSHRTDFARNLENKENYKPGHLINFLVSGKQCVPPL